ncbi:hypothetical protein O9929_26080 [Vibrio lentus]|nr:hypothetical protein [Vibrio lentus]
MKQNASLKSVDHVCEKHNIAYQCEARDAELNLPYYWLTICLDNLIKNAKQHGQGKVLVKVILADKLRIEVQDEVTSLLITTYFKNNTVRQSQTR